MIRKGNVLTIVSQILILILILGMFYLILIEIKSLNKKTSVEVALKPVKNEKVLPNYILVTNTIDTDIELNMLASISKIDCEVFNVTVPKTFTLEISVGCALKQNSVVATNGEKKIMCPIDGRLIGITEFEHNYLLEIDLFANYAINFSIKLNEFIIYKDLFQSLSEVMVSVSINDYKSFAIVKNCVLNMQKGVYEIKLHKLSYNPYIFTGFKVKLYRMVEKRDSYLLFPKSCYYTLSADNSIVAKKILLSEDGQSAEIEDVTLYYNPDLYIENYFCVINPEIHKGNYMVN